MEIKCLRKGTRLEEKESEKGKRKRGEKKKERKSNALYEQVTHKKKLWRKTYESHVQRNYSQQILY